MEQWNRIESSEVNPDVYSPIFFAKGAKNIQWRKESLFNKWFWENWKGTCKIMKLDYTLSSYTKVNSKWIKHLNIRSETIIYMEENIGMKIMDLGLREDFVNLIPGSREVQAEITAWDYIKLKKLLLSKRNWQENKKTKSQMGEDIYRQQLPQEVNIQIIQPKCPSVKKWIKKLWNIYTMEYHIFQTITHTRP